MSILSAKATTITATIETKSKVSLSCEPAVDMPPSLQATYSNSGSKGQVTQSDSALMVLTGIPKGEIRSVVLYVASNKSSGAATITASLSDSTWQVASGLYRDWLGNDERCYSLSALPIPALQKPLAVEHNASLQIRIRGEVNSVNWSSMKIEYTEAPQEPHWVSLHWRSTDGNWHVESIQEDSAGAGVILPAIEDADSIMDTHGETWYWMGWCEQIIASTTDEPLHWQNDDWYGPDEDTNLYALYSNTRPYVICKDTSFISAEYALAREYDSVYYVLSGSWTNGQMELLPVEIQTDAWELDTLPTTCRYSLNFDADSVSIKNVGNNTWIGHSTRAATNQPSRWAWKRAAAGSIYIHHDWQFHEEKPHIPAYYSAMCPALVFNDIPHIAYMEDNYSETYSYWLLFPTAGIPATHNALYTTFPTWSVDSSPRHSLSPRKYILNNQLYLFINHQRYNVLGQPL